MWQTFKYYQDTGSMPNLLQTIGCEVVCKISVVPSGWVIVVRKTMRHRVDFFLLRDPD
jgi:hypothetical protein